MPEGALLRSLLIVVGFLLLLLVGAYWLRRWNLSTAGHRGGQLAILARLPLPPKAMLYAVRLGERVLLLAVTEHAVTLLRELSLEEWRTATAVGNSHAESRG
jgi:flagellar biogenesis protein FliO